ncbi:sporulation protein [Streptomyces sp. NPDC058746]|uniref:sporulation protein n=1 Tax=Streptomyces sp. NPDC058746 TaxID=3346622 RepID=UPI0036CD7B9F
MSSRRLPARRDPARGDRAACTRPGCGGADRQREARRQHLARRRQARRRRHRVGRHVRALPRNQPVHRREGQETRVPLRFRLRWESPVSEVRGQRLDGMRLGVYTSVEASGIEGRTDSDPLRIGATPRRGIPAGPRGPRTTTFPAPSARSSTCGRASASSTRGP